MVLDELCWLNASSQLRNTPSLVVHLFSHLAPYIFAMGLLCARHKIWL